MPSLPAASHPAQFRRSILAIARVSIVTWWGVGLPYSLFSWLLDAPQLRWVLICYAWEVPVACGLGPVLFPLLWFRDIERRWERIFGDAGPVQPAQAAALEATILEYPMRVARVVLITSLLGYAVGAVQLRVFAQLPVSELVKILALGLATGLIGGLFAFLYLESLLGPLLERFAGLGEVAPPATRRVPLYVKVFACSLIMTLTALLLLGTIFYTRGERVLEEEVGRRLLAEAHYLAANLDEVGLARASDPDWWHARERRMGLGPSGYAYLLDANGAVVAGGAGARRLDEEGFRPEVTRTILTAPEGHEVDRTFIQRIIAFAAFPAAPLRVVTVAQRHEFGGELESMLRRGVVVFMGSLLLALVQGFLFSRRLTQPIEVVTRMASKIARAPGEPWETVPVRTDDEVGELATAFNQMIARLEEARDHLERRVAEATRSIATLYEVTRATTSTLEIENVLKLVAEKTLATLGLERLVVLWRTPELGDVVDAYVAAAGGQGERLEVNQAVDLAGLCPPSRQPTVMALAPVQAILPAPLAAPLATPRGLCLPLVFKDELLGVILAGLERDASPPDFELAAALASQAAAALANAGLFETVRRTELELRKLSQMRAQLQEESLRTMSRELHDGFGQVLTVVNMNLGIIERAHDLDPAALRSRLREVREQVTGLLQEVRTMSQVLRPPMLDFGVIPTLRWFIEKFTLRTHIPVGLRLPPEETRFPTGVELLLYRVTQEALTNVVKHAKASRVDIELTVHGGEITFAITDDGLGFDVERFRRTPVLGSGLLGMRERVAYYRGHLDIRSRPREGVRITITIPLDATASEV